MAGCENSAAFGPIDSVAGRTQGRQVRPRAFQCRSQIKDFFFKEGLLYFDAAINERFDTGKDIDPDRLAGFARDAGIPPDIDAIDALRNINLLTDEGMTNAGCLVLGRMGSKYLVSATITCALFQGDSKVKILDQKVYDGNIASNYHNTILYLQSHLNTEYIIATSREERLELPEMALREALINALAHRDYRSPADIQVYIFSDRVEIVNPGGLVGGMELKDLGSRSIPRNPLLFGTLYRMKLVEHVGSGIKRIRKALSDVSLPEPVLQVDEQWFSISFSRRPAGTSLKAAPGLSPSLSPSLSPRSLEERDAIILKALAANPMTTLRQLAELCDVDLRTIKRHVARLKKEGLLQRSGGSFGGQWVVVE